MSLQQHPKIKNRAIHCKNYAEVKEICRMFNEYGFTRPTGGQFDPVSYDEIAFTRNNIKDGIFVIQADGYTSNMKYIELNPVDNLYTYVMTVPEFLEHLQQVKISEEANAPLNITK